MKLLDEIKAYATFILIVIGIAGVTMDTFKEGGFLERAWGGIWNTVMRHPILIVPIAVLLVMSLYLRSRRTPGKTKRSLLIDVPIYLFMACGAYYLYKWLTHH